MKPTIYMVLLILVSVGCKSHRLLGVTPCPGAWDKDSSVVYSETYYQYKYLQEVEAGDMDPLLTQRLDSLYSFTVKVSGHEGWSVNTGSEFNEYYHPEYFVIQNPNEFEGKSRNDHDFSLYCPNALSEKIRLLIDNDLQQEISELKVTVRPYQYLYNKKQKIYRPLIKIVSVDTLFFD